MQDSKIRLSPSEAALFCNAEIILTKNIIIQKTIALLTDVQEQMVVEKAPTAAASTPKISKGENYLGLPYVVLDYPRIAAGEDLFFIRSLFWWGNFFSSTLQLSGRYKEENSENLAAAYEDLSAGNYFIGISEDPWQHHFEASNMQAIARLSREEYGHLLGQQPYIKIAARWSLIEWDAAANTLVSSWKKLVQLVA